MSAKWYLIIGMYVCLFNKLQEDTFQLYTVFNNVR